SVKNPIHNLYLSHSREEDIHHRDIPIQSVPPYGEGKGHKEVKLSS
ncbi:unnamed protein product, partial [marine sediment metagenome]